MKQSALFFVISTLAMSQAIAHETWLLPEDFLPEPGKATTLFMTSGMDFPALNAGISPSRIKEAVFRQGAQKQLLVPAGGIKGALKLSAIPGPGVACALVALEPRILEIEEDGVAHYLEEVGAGDDLWAAWDAQEKPRAWRESYSKLARSYLGSAGEQVPAKGENCWSETSNTRFDLLPMSNPADLSPGDSLTLRVLFDGEPLADQAIAVRRAGDSPQALTRSDKLGQLTLRFTAPGRYMIYGTQLRPVPSENREDGANWESDFVTLTLEVR